MAANPESEPVPPIDGLLDVLVFLPLGALLEACDALPHLAERGRSRLLGQVPAARIIGRMVVTRAERELKKRLEGATPDPANAPAPAAEPRSEAKAPAAPVVVIDDQPDAASTILPIEDYDSLAASQVVPRLAALSARELAGVRRYEEIHRARRTILGRISQLQKG